MEVLEGVRGNVAEDAELAAARDRHQAAGTLERLRIDDTQRRKSRFRATTDAGTDVGVVVSDSEPLAPGDVLLVDERMIVVELAEIPVLAVTLPAGTDPPTAVVVGHTAGNRHWELAVKEGTVYVPAGPDPDSRQRTLETVLPASAAVERTAVSPSLFDGTHTQGAGHTTQSSHPSSAGDGTTPKDDHAIRHDHTHHQRQMGRHSQTDHHSHADRHSHTDDHTQPHEMDDPGHNSANDQPHDHEPDEVTRND